MRDPIILLVHLIATLARLMGPGGLRSVVADLRTDERTQAFAQRKVASGKSKLEAIRCIKRYIAREVYPLVKANIADVGGSTSAP